MATKKSGATLAELHDQIAALRAQAEELRKSEVAEVVAKIKVAIAQYGITASDLGLRATRARSAAAGSAATVKRRKSKARTPAAKYADGQGNEWVGMGKRPDWFKAALAAGKTPEDLLVKKG